MKFKSFCKKNISRGAAVMFIIAAICLIIKGIAVLSVSFADFFNRYISAIFRAAFAHLTSVLPFSVAETLIICAIPLAAVFLVYCIKVSAKEDKLLRQTFRVLAVICFIFSTFVLNYATGYDGAALDEKMSLEAASPSEDDLYTACAMTMIELYNLEDEVTVAKSGSTKMPYSFGEMTDKLNDAYDALYEEYDFLSPLHTGVKRIALSPILTYTHMSGFYTFFTGEANVNTNYPDYVVVFTTAHEMAHQRGIAREDEANFVAFLACTASDDAYIRYCGYTNMLEYLASAFHSMAPERYQKEIVAFLPETTIGEFRAYAAFFDKYADNAAADISSAANDTYLKSQGVAEGEKSYGLVVDLAVAYLKGLTEVTE